MLVRSRRSFSPFFLFSSLASSLKHESRSRDYRKTLLAHLSLLGLKKWFASHGVLNVVELDWWQRATVKDSCFITCLPTQHWSNRGLFDKNETLWGSFSIKSVISGRTAYFGGDTGYCGAFKEIGEHVGPFDLAIIPIGAYCPRELMRYAHVEPAEVTFSTNSSWISSYHLSR